ncbi:hypothetical protein ACQPXM_30605 [Kribbella sp. CA-253562]|uniref:hypothetical protein n=1 Tax=Kribbella sp. CA-253562 TaxID=3239942 RepID=UPI003D8E61D8
MDEPDWWLEGGVFSLTDGAEAGFTAEFDRVIDLLGEDTGWLSWWRSASKAPVLQIEAVVLKPLSPLGAEGLARIGADERVIRGRKRHLVRLHVDFEALEQLEPDERRMWALPVVLDGIGRVREKLRLAGDPPQVPDVVLPLPLSVGTLRRRRLRELLDARNGQPLRDPERTVYRPLRPTGEGALLTEVLRPPERLPVRVVRGPGDGPLVVEVQVPVTDEAYGDEWIDEVDGFLADEASDGSFVVQDVSTGEGDVHVFVLSGASEEELLAVAERVAGLPGVPTGVVAYVMAD